jgi:hypothetical protein
MSGQTLIHDPDGAVPASVMMTTQLTTDYDLHPKKIAWLMQVSCRMANNVCQNACLCPVAAGMLYAQEGRSRSLSDQEAPACCMLLVGVRPWCWRWSIVGVAACEWAVLQLWLSQLPAVPAWSTAKPYERNCCCCASINMHLRHRLQEMLFTVSKSAAQNQRDAVELKRMMAAADAMVSLASSGSYW